MRGKLIGGLALTLVLFFSLSSEAGPGKVHKYIGIKKCKMCHQTAARGKQYQKWASGPHAKAYETLATPEAKQVAEKAGVKGDPQKAAECLVCHVTAYNAPASQKAPTYKMEEGVTCEACHGPGSDYWSLKVMKGLAAGTIEPASVGMTVPNEKTCVTCHNKKSPTYKPFDYKKFYAEIAHPRPKK